MKHKQISLLKSVIRIAGYLSLLFGFTFRNIAIAMIILIFAEVLGILEEL
jgi:hypothetical protein